VHEGLKLGSHLRVPAQRQVGVDACLQSGQAHLFQTGRLRGAEQRVLEVRVRRSAPQAQRLTQKPGSDVVRTRGGGFAGRRDKIRELQRIHLPAADRERVASPAAGKDGAVGCPPARLEHFAHPDGIRLHRFTALGGGSVPHSSSMM